MFKVGDKVRAFGVNGVVESIDTDLSYPVRVRHENGEYTCFTTEGNHFLWGKEPSLVLVERPKKLVKLYQYACLIDSKWIASACFHEDENDFLKTCNIYEQFKRLDHTMIEVEE